MIEREQKPIIQTHLPSEDLLQAVNVITPSERAVGIKRIFDSGLRAESYIYGYKITVRGDNGEETTRYVRERSTLSFGFDLKEKTIQYWDKLLGLKDEGVPVLEPYGMKGATIYQEFIVNDQTKTAFATLKRPDLNEQTESWLNQLIHIAVRLDKAGFLPQGFLSDLIFDGDRDIFLLMDVGQDLGYPGQSKEPFATVATDQLKKQFPHHKDYIEKKVADLKEAKPSQG